MESTGSWYKIDKLFSRSEKLLINRIKVFSEFGIKYNYLNYDVQDTLMKYLYLLLLTVLFIPISQVAYGQNIIDQIGQAFNNLTSGVMGGNEANQSASSGGSANQSASSGGSANQSEQGIGSIQELQTLTSGNQELLENNTSVAPENNSLGLGLEREQYVESENQSNAMAAANNTQ